VRPTRATIALLALWGLAGLAIPLASLATAHWLWAGAALGLVLLLDALVLARQPSPTLRRRVAAVLPLGPWATVTLELANTARGALHGTLHDGHPGDWAVEDQPRALRIAAREVLELAYRVQAPRRGEARFEAAWWQQGSPLRLWTQQRRIGGEDALRVFPNFAPLASLALHTAEQASRMSGAHLARKRGDGTEFHQMREYRTGDSLRQIDWKATARARRLISREYQEEKNQRVTLLLDCGRRMLAEDGGLTHFDHALNAALLLAYTALRQGDAVALQTFGAVDRAVPPVRGAGALDALIEATFDVQPAPVAADYLEAARRVLAQNARRSLVLVVTNVRDEDADDLLAGLKLLQRRHLVCVASLREGVLDEALAMSPQRFEDALRVGATHQYLASRRLAHAQLRAQKVDVLDVRCEQLPAALVQHYLAVKRAGRL
jgi:uncharacterized protein (DUF58 family)